MDCTHIQELMSLALDGQLTAEETTEFNEHLASCDDCAQEYALYRSIQAGLNSLGEEEAELPAGFHEQLMSSVAADSVIEEEAADEEDKAIPLFKRLPQRYMNLAAVFVLVAVFALVGINNLDNIRNTREEAPMAPAATEQSVSNEAAYEMVEEAADMAAAPEAEMAVTEEAATEADRPQEAVTSAPAPAMMAEPAADVPEMAAEEAPVAGSVDVSETEESVSLTFEEKISVDADLSDDSVGREMIVADIPEEDGADDGASTATTSDSGLARDGDDSERLPKSVEYGDSELSASAEKDGNAGLWVMILGSFAVIAGGIFAVRRKG